MVLACPNQHVYMAEGALHAGYGSPETLQQINFVRQYLSRS